jgi:hypothetical protein
MLVNIHCWFTCFMEVVTNSYVPIWTIISYTYLHTDKPPPELCAPLLGLLHPASLVCAVNWHEPRLMMSCTRRVDEDFGKLICMTALIDPNTCVADARPQPRLCYVLLSLALWSVLSLLVIGNEIVMYRVIITQAAWLFCLVQFMCLIFIDYLSWKI